MIKKQDKDWEIQTRSKDRDTTNPLLAVFSPQFFDCGL